MNTYVNALADGHTKAYSTKKPHSQFPYLSSSRTHSLEPSSGGAASEIPDNSI